MKKIFLPMAHIMCCAVFAQSNSLAFTYDASGNQIVRELICVTCDEPSASRVAGAPDTFIKSPEHEDVSFYPNPVKEELNIKWTATESDFVTEIQVYSISGQVVATQSGLDGKNTASVGFLNIAEGIYNVVLFYNNGERKTLKVVKK